MTREEQMSETAPKKQLIIDAFVVKSEYKSIPENTMFVGNDSLNPANPSDTNEDDKLFRYDPCVESLKKQSASFEVPVNIEILELEEIPPTTDSFLTVFLHENSLITPDYIPRLMAMNNLFKSAAAFCGPHHTRSRRHPDWFISRILHRYKNYEIDSFDTSLVCKITDEQLNYPPIYGSVIPSRYYNEVGGYQAIKTPRSVLENNSRFFKSLSALGDIIYSSRLNTSYFISPEEFELENFSKYYYNLGYSRGLVTDPEEEFDPFLLDASLLEIKNTDWANLNEAVPEYLKSVYKRNISVFRCSYELGFFEAVTGQKIA
tara:strand:+ start:3329 stop:4282 length:954 start_codon:yes stop_codon:yes gene_type:complete